jgi:hypothetical protein
MGTTDSILSPRFATLGVLVVAAAATRLLPHPPNMTSVTALALFGGAYFSRRWLAFAVTLLTLLASDLVLGLYPHMEVQYLSFALVVCIGFVLQRRRSVTALAVAALASSVAFFVLTNLGVWAFSALYPKTIAGLMTCYVAALPFFRNTLLGDLGYTALLFGGFHLLERHFDALKERTGERPATFAPTSSAPSG